MKKSTNRLQRRGHRYFIRVAVPHALRPVLGKNEIIRTLGTGDRSEALRRLIRVNADVEDLFDDARRTLAAGPVTNLDDLEVRQLAVRWLHAAERRAATADAAHGIRMDRSEAKTQAADDIGELADAESPNALAAVQTEVARLMKANGVALAPGTPAHGLLCQLVSRAMAESTRRAFDRMSGAPARSNDPMFNGVTADSPEPAAPATVSLAGLVVQFLDDPTRSAGAKEDKDFGVVLRYLAEFVPEDTPVCNVTRDNCRSVASLLKRLPANVSKRMAFRGLSPLQAAAEAERLGLPPMSPTTANNYIGKMSALFKWAVREGLCDRNPAEALLLPRDSHARDARRPFTIDNLNVVFSADVYKEPRGAWDHRQWAPVISLFTGLRMNEVCTLRADDVAEVGGVMVIHIRPDADGKKKLKSRAAKRVVPVHPTLVKVGFLDFVERQRKAGAVLFPSLKPDRRGYFSDGFQRWFGRHLLHIGAKAPRTSYHSLRHNFRDALREADVKLDSVLALGGWAGNGGVSETYGAGLKPSTLARAIAKVKYPGLDLRHLQAK